MHTLITTMTTLLRRRWLARRDQDRGATAIEWAVFAMLSLTIAASVAAAINAAINHRLPGIQ